jgi:hypothetical protein
MHMASNTLTQHPKTDDTLACERCSAMHGEYTPLRETEAVFIVEGITTSGHPNIVAVCKECFDPEEDKIEG